MGVSAIKVDFGEGAPAAGNYFSGKTGFYEHNLYPLRYNKAAADITRSVRGENIIWARSAWAGSQRYPLHWGGDVANTSTGMQATLRGGLSFGLSGFSFWSHDIGGFAGKSPEELYRRWMPFGMLSSHSRCHGAPPKEPWEYRTAFLNEFREDVNMKYRLMPYVYAQAKYASDHGLPMVRALFVEYPGDAGAWLIDDEYLFGSDILVAPIFTDSLYERNVYLPGGEWIDYQTKQVYSPGWHKIKAGKLPVVILVRNGAIIPKIKLAQSTADMNWKDIELAWYASGNIKLSGYFCSPADNIQHEIILDKNGNNVTLVNNPLKGKVNWKIIPFNNDKD
jgi:alpha-D-xyloside xylohydrolase